MLKHLNLLGLILPTVNKKKLTIWLLWVFSKICGQGQVFGTVGLKCHLQHRYSIVECQVFSTDSILDGSGPYDCLD